MASTIDRAIQGQLNDAWTRLMRLVGFTDIPAPTFLSNDRTSGTTILYVATTGNDLNPGTEAAPFLTVEAAINSVPKLIRHPVIIRIGAGTYTAGAFVSGFTFNPADDAVGAYLRIEGTMAAVTGLTGGTASGTITARGAGTASSTVYGTITDSGQAWTTNELRGKIVRVNSAIPTYEMIVSNTATALTIAGTLSGATVSTTYDILDWSTVFTGGLDFPPSGVSDSAFGGNNQAVFWFHSNGPGPTGVTGSVLQFVKFALTTGAAININGNTGITIQNCSFDAVMGINQSSITGPALVSFQRCYYNNQNGSSATSMVFTNSSAAEITATRCVADMRDNDSYWLSLGGCRSTITTNSVEAKGATVTSNPYIRMSPGQGTFISGNKFVGQDSGSQASVCIKVDTGFSSLHGANGGTMTFLGNEFVDFGIGVHLTTNAFATFSGGTVAGSFFTDCVTGLKLQDGARAKVTSGMTWSGCTNDIDLDGDTMTIAELRAVTGPPAKSVTDPATLSRVWEG